MVFVSEPRLIFRSPFSLHQDGKIEPQIIIWLNSTSTLMEASREACAASALTQPTRTFAVHLR